MEFENSAELEGS